jgi:serine/threonine protein kinase
MKSRRKDLRIDVKGRDDDKDDVSFIADGNVFIKDNVAINATGVAMRDNPKTFTLHYDELEIGEMIGRGSSSVVLQAYHGATGTPLALKVMSMFDKSKREQLIREVCTLYDADCQSLVNFYGAFYREGCITVALEYMNGGSLANVLAQVSC